MTGVCAFLEGRLEERLVQGPCQLAGSDEHGGVEQQDLARELRAC